MTRKNINILNDLMSEYYTDVTEFSYNQGRDFYNAMQQQRQNRQSGRAANFIIGGQIFNALLVRLQSIDFCRAVIV